MLSTELIWFMVWFMVFNATFNNISVISWGLVLLVEETGVPGENHEPTEVTDKLYHIMLYHQLNWHSPFNGHLDIARAISCGQ